MIHAQAFDGKYNNDLFRKRTRKTLDQLWAEYAKAKKAPDGGRTLRLANVRSSLALAFRGPESKAEVTLMALSRNKEQVWRLEKVKDNFVIVNVATKMVLEGAEGSREKGAGGPSPRPAATRRTSFGRWCAWENTSGSGRS